MLDDVSLVFCVTADVSVRERMVRRLDGLGTLVICSDLTELQAMIGPPAGGGPAALSGTASTAATAAGTASTSAAASTAAAAASTSTAAAVAAASAPAAAARAPGATTPAAVTTRRISLGDLTIDPLDHLVIWRGAPLALTRLERNLLTQLASAPVGVWTYERLFESVWGGAYLGDTSILHSAVKRLRRKLRAADGTLRVQTVRGIGYRLSVD